MDNFKPCTHKFFEAMKKQIRKKNPSNVFLTKSFIQNGAIRWKATGSVDPVQLKPVIDVSKACKRFIHFNTGILLVQGILYLKELMGIQKEERCSQIQN
jgi:hypothetical protein